jgi:hypothetical protein
MTLEMKVKLSWESHPVVWLQNTEGMEKASTFIVLVGEEITSRG